jgi:hypothetical protein
MPPARVQELVAQIRLIRVRSVPWASSSKEVRFEEESLVFFSINTLDLQLCYATVEGEHFLILSLSDERFVQGVLDEGRFIPKTKLKNIVRLLVFEARHSSRVGMQE